MSRPAALYLSAAFERQAELRGYRDALRARGIPVISRWLDEVDSEEWFDVRQACAMEDLADIVKADIFVAFTDGAPGRGGRQVELGAALVLGKWVIVVGPHEHVFHAHPRVIMTLPSPTAFLQQCDEITVEGPEAVSATPATVTLEFDEGAAVRPRRDTDGDARAVARRIEDLRVSLIRAINTALSRAGVDLPTSAAVTVEPSFATSSIPEPASSVPASSAEPVIEIPQWGPVAYERLDEARGDAVARAFPTMCTPLDSRICWDAREAEHCTRERGHAGPHVAHAATGPLLRSVAVAWWPADTPPEIAPGFPLAAMRTRAVQAEAERDEARADRDAAYREVAELVTERDELRARLASWPDDLRVAAIAEAEEEAKRAVAAERERDAAIAERDVLAKEKQDDAWHRGWQVAVKERDAARVEVTKLLSEIRYLTNECDELRRGSSLLASERNAARAAVQALEDWRADVTVALQRPGGALLANVPKHVRDLVRERNDLKRQLAEARAESEHRRQQMAEAVGHSCACVYDWEQGGLCVSECAEHQEMRARADNAEQALAEATTWRPMATAPDDVRALVLVPHEHTPDSPIAVVLDLPRTSIYRLKALGWLPIPPYRATEGQ